MAEQQKNEVRVIMEDFLNEQLTTYAHALPGDLNRMRFVQEIVSVWNGNPDLQKCSKSSVVNSVMKGAFLGLSFAMKECYIIPYGNTATFQTDYKGEIKFTKKYSKRPIKEIYAKVVRKGDNFVEKIVDGHPSIDFEPMPFNGNDVIGVFAVCLYEDGAMIYETMSIDEVQAIRKNYSKAAQSKAWTVGTEMYKKVVLRRLCKHIDTDFNSVEAQAAWEEGSGMDFSNSGSAVDHSNISQPFGKKEEATETDENIIDGVATEIPDVPNFA